MSELARRDGARPPAEIETPAEAELALRRQQAILDVLRRGRASVREQVVALRGCVEYAVRGVDLVDEMRAAGELTEQVDGRPRKASEVRTLTDVGLTRQRVAEWRSLRDNDALVFIDRALTADREDTLRRASGLNWVRLRVERIARETSNGNGNGEPLVYDPKVRHGDLRETLADLSGVDAIITDPPYPAAFLDEYDALGALAKRILRPDGVLVAMVGQAHLPRYIERIAPHIPYRWCGAYLTDGPAVRIHGRDVASKWKPLLVFGGNRFITQDVFSSAGVDKRHHGWGQSESGMADIVERLTELGELVVDPFLGGGTTAVVCRDLGRRFVGCDTDAAAVAATRERLAA